MQQRERSAALRMLRGAAAEGSVGMAALRRLLSEGLPGLVTDGLDDSAVLELLASRIESGQVVALQRRTAPRTWSERSPGAPPEAPQPIFAPQVETTWVEVQLLDMVGEPVSGERYRIRLPDGTLKEGRLNYRGRARIEDITTPGACRISFPDLDAEAWEALGDGQAAPG